MNTEDFIAGLYDDDFYIRSSTLSILSCRPDATTQVSRAVVNSCREHGYDNAFEFLHLLKALPIDEALFYDVVADLSKDGPERLIEVDASRNILNWLAWRTPVATLKKGIAKLAALPPKSFESKFGNWLAISLDLADRRLAMANMSALQVREMLEVLFNQCSKSGEFPHSEVEDFRLIAERLAHDKVILPDPELFEWFNSENLNDFDSPDIWKAGFAVILAEHRKLAAASSDIIKLVELDWDWINEAIMSYIGATTATSDSLLKTVLSDFPFYKSEFIQLFLSGGIDKSRIQPEVESLVAQAIASSSNEMTQISLANYLALIGTDSALQIVDNVFHDTEWSSESQLLAETLNTIYILRGDKSERSVYYRKKVEQILQQREKFEADMDFPILEDYLSFADSQIFQKQPSFNSSSVLHSPKIGRNQPCPCGSGKKHKKCCLRQVG